MNFGSTLSSNGQSSSLPQSSSSGAAANSYAAAAAAASVQPASNNNNNNEPAIWDFDTALLHQWVRKSTALHGDPKVSETIWERLRGALDALRESVQKIEQPRPDDNDDERLLRDDDHSRKRRKRTTTIRTLHDPYHIWIGAWKDNPGDGPSRVLEEDADDVPDGAGGKFTQLSLGGMINALAGVVGGVTHRSAPTAASVKIPSSSGGGGAAAEDHGAVSAALDGPIVYEAASKLHRACAARIQADVLRTTPLRIHALLASELSPQEFATIKKRIFDTVVKGKGRAILVDDDNADLAIAPALATATQSTVDRNQKCNTCGNQDQALFILDRKNGDIICSNCGTVVSESLMHEGSQYRKFEGEVDRNHHGDAANPLFSNAQNMSTSLGGATMTTVTRGMGGKSNLETILRNAHAYTELNLSNFGKNDRRTRTGYKDRQKKEAFVQMAHVGDALNLHEAVIQRAKELFAGFRDDRELVQQFKGVIAACLVIAFEQLSEEGRSILKSAEQAEASIPLTDDDGKVKALSARAARRNQLHHANLAGKGGLLLDFSSVTPAETSVAASSSSSSISAATALSTSPKAIEKPAATWDLLDCRSWLLDASRRIANQWIEERNAGAPSSKRLPAGTLEELEGQLVEHSITLCEQLEKEVNDAAGTSASLSKNKVVTPRVKDMSKLGIKWQHSYERGSGGKGGVGGSGVAQVKSGSSRTAGQILILKTSKKLGEILEDPFSGEALHKELRGLLAQQETRKQKLMREEASRLRLQQMKRKPWLQAKIQA